MPAPVLLSGTFRDRLALKISNKVLSDEYEHSQYAVHCCLWEDLFSWFWGGLSNWMLKLCVRHSSKLLWLLKYWWLLPALRQQTWSSLLGFSRDTSGLLKVQLCFTVYVMLCALSMTARLASLLSLGFFFCQPKEPSIWLHLRYRSALVQYLYQQSSTKGRRRCGKHLTFSSLCNADFSPWAAPVEGSFFCRTVLLSFLSSWYN